MTQRQEQLYSHLQYYLEQLDITNNVEINKTSTDNQATVTLNKTLFQTIVEQNKNIDDYSHGGGPVNYSTYNQQSNNCYSYLPQGKREEPVPNLQEDVFP